MLASFKSVQSVFTTARSTAASTIWHELFSFCPEMGFISVSFEICQQVGNNSNEIIQNNVQKRTQR